MNSNGEGRSGEAFLLAWTSSHCFSLAIMEAMPLFAKPSSTLRCVPVLTVGFRPPPMSSVCFKK